MEQSVFSPKEKERARSRIAALIFTVEQDFSNYGTRASSVIQSDTGT